MGNEECQYSNMEEIRREVIACDGVLSLTMGQLRDACDAGRLGSNIVKSIAEKLKAAGLGYYPKELPKYQNHWVRVYVLESPMEELIEAVLTPSEEDDQYLRDKLATNAHLILGRIKELCAGF